MQIWESDINAKGGLLGRKVQLVFYDDQSNPSTVPGIYTKLIDVDKVDLVVSGYATNMIVPALPIVMQRNLTFLALFGLAANSEFHYPNYFAMIPTGVNAKVDFSKGFFDVAMAQSPKPQTVALVGADAEFPRNPLDGARENVKTAGLKVVYDKTYPPNTVDYTPIVRAIQATNPDVVYVASYPPDSVGMIRAANEVGLKAKQFGGGMVGLQSTAIKPQLGPLLNGIVNFDCWIPAPTMQFQGVLDMLKQYQAKSANEGVDTLGWYIAPWGYAYLEVLGQAIEGAKSIDQAKLADYLRTHTFKTVVGDVKFGKDGEWEKARVIFLQYRGFKSSDMAEFRDTTHQVIVDPPQYKVGDAIYPYNEAKTKP